MFSLHDNVVSLAAYRARALLDPLSHPPPSPIKPPAARQLQQLERENAELRQHLLQLALELQRLKRTPGPRQRQNSPPP